MKFTNQKVDELKMQETTAFIYCNLVKFIQFTASRPEIAAEN